mgnify:CR=1 FL=1
MQILQTRIVTVSLDDLQLMMSNVVRKELETLVNNPLLGDDFKDELWDRKQAAAFLGISEQTLIKIVLEGNDLIFEVFNTKVKTIPKIESGFGIENIQLRLNLLYPEKHLLIINNDNQKYQIILKLKLND